MAENKLINITFGVIEKQTTGNQLQSLTLGPGTLWEPPGKALYGGLVPVITSCLYEHENKRPRDLDDLLDLFAR